MDVLEKTLILAPKTSQEFGHRIFLVTRLREVIGETSSCEVGSNFVHPLRCSHTGDVRTCRFA
jgi:hypothetical protein